ncbi:hypothetical protein MMYC01_202598 [Madurella mycetomatis]|uniref:Vacuolar membrane protein n=1 Tax=Madurella mycetomatis TaxID=100816 RepID=A0A175WAB2_9PEZI|nr:hypothetical protein MMYC01_202598 [Madurella mycetomatis]
MLPPSANLSPLVGPALALPPDVTSSIAAAVAAATDLPFRLGVDNPGPGEAAAAAAGEEAEGEGEEATTPTTVVVVTTMTPSATAPATATATPGPGSPSSPMDDQPTECRLLGPFAILVQLALGALALLSLVYKRWRERPQRPVKIWFFDVSKQVFGSVLVHAANVVMSLFTSGRFTIRVVDPVVAVSGVARRAAGAVVGGGMMMGIVARAHAEEEYVPNPCSFYLLNLAIDTTIGIPILIVIVRVITRLVALTPFGNPPESSVIYFCGLMGMKFVVLIIFMVLPWLPHVGDWALGWTEGNEKLQIFFVMMLFPLIMNALQYYIIDSYIKKQETQPEDETGAGVGGTAVYEELSASETDGSDGEEDEDTTKTNGGGSRVRMARRDSRSDRGSRDFEYDPAVDGDSQTVIGSGANRTSNRGALPKELLPPE